MGFKKYSTAPLEVVGEDEKPEWVKKAAEEDAAKQEQETPNEEGN